MTDRRIVFKLGNPSDGTTRRFDYKPGSWPSWSDLSKRIESLFNIPKEFVELTYIDEDKDEIRMRSNSELKEYYASHQGYPGTFIARFTIRDMRQDMERVEHVRLPSTALGRVQTERNVSMRNRRSRRIEPDTASEETTESSAPPSSSTSTSRRSRTSRHSSASSSRPSSMLSTSSSATLTPAPSTAVPVLEQSRNSRPPPGPAANQVIYVITDSSSIPNAAAPAPPTHADTASTNLRRTSTILSVIPIALPLRSMRGEQTPLPQRSVRSSSPTPSSVVRQWLTDHIPGVHSETGLSRQTSVSTQPPPYTVMEEGNGGQDTPRRFLRRARRAPSS